MLVENARAMALEVEQKVANANIFAEQVSSTHRCELHKLKIFQQQPPFLSLEDVCVVFGIFCMTYCDLCHT